MRVTCASRQNRDQNGRQQREKRERERSEKDDDIDEVNGVPKRIPQSWSMSGLETKGRLDEFAMHSSVNMNTK